MALRLLNSSRMRIRTALFFALAALASFVNSPHSRRRHRPRHHTQTAANGIRQSRFAGVDAPRRRASRPPRGIQRRRLRRQSRGSVLAEPLSRHRQVLDEAVAERSGAGAGRARRGTERRHHRRAVPRSVRPAARARRRRSVREEPVRAARRTAGARVRRSAARRARQLAQHRALVRCRARRLPAQETEDRWLRRLGRRRFRWTTSIAAAPATTCTARMRRSQSCRMRECSSRICSFAPRRS